MGTLAQAAGSLLGSSGPSAPSVRRPVFEIEIGSAGAKEWQQAVVSFTVESSIAPAVDSMQVLSSPLSDAPSASLRDDANVSAGYQDGAASALFKGKVDAVRASIQGPTRITAVN